MIEIAQTEAQAAIDNLKRYNLVMETSGGRVPRYSQNLKRVLQVPSQSEALLAILMLRGPQTVGELRINSERLHRFADTSAVEGFLQELATRASGPLVVELPRLPGARENRWAHMLGGAPQSEPHAVEVQPRSQPSSEEVAALKTTVARLENELQGLKALVARICEKFGIPIDHA